MQTESSLRLSQSSHHRLTFGKEMTAGFHCRLRLVAQALPVKQRVQIRTLSESTHHQQRLKTKRKKMKTIHSLSPFYLTLAATGGIS